ncbi:MAG: oligoendopeptidase F, partial [Lactococcus garvieae]
MAKKRDKIAENLTWDLSTVFENDAAWELELKRVSEKLETVNAYEGHLLDSAQSLLEITEMELEISRAVEKVYVYASMKHDQDTQVSLYQEYEAKATNLYAKFGESF